MPSSSHNNDPSRALSSQKRSFLSSQIRLLSTPLTTPSSNISTSLTSSSKYKLDTVIPKVNRKIRQHNQLVFPTQSQRHVLEQVEAVYWRDALTEVYDVENAEYLRGREESTLLKRNDDFREAEIVERLPNVWEDVVLRPLNRRCRDAEQDAEIQSELYDQYGNDAAQAEEYTRLHAALTAQMQRRESLRRQLEQYRSIATLLKPYENAKENIQPNLVTRGGELERELDRMRVLCARVKVRAVAGIGAREIALEGRNTSPKVVDEMGKLEHILGLG